MAFTWEVEMNRNLSAMMLAAMISIPLTGCDEGNKGDRNNVSNTITGPSTVTIPTPTPTIPAPFAGAVQQIGTQASGHCYVYWFGNLNGLQNIQDWNGVQFNLFVTGPNGRVKKYVTEAYNSEPTINNTPQPGTIIRDIDCADEVKFELRVIERGKNDYTQITYPNRADRGLFRLEPENFKLDGNFTVGPKPARTSSLTN